MPYGGRWCKKGWLLEEDNGLKGRIRRTEKYGAAFFDGVLAPYAHESLKSRIMGLLDQRVVTIIFGDNAISPLLSPSRSAHSCDL